MSCAGFKHAVLHPDNNQRGAAFVVMLVVLVLGVSAILIGSLNSVAAKNERNAKAADALAQAREALIGYAVSDENRPGELPCPDTDNDGSAETLAGNDCAGGNLGRLPWRTLGLPDLRDAAGERLWYAVSDPFHAGDNAVLNSDTTGTISVAGNLVANNVIAIVFSPGQLLPPMNQVRSTANENTYSHYLESVLISPTSFQQLTPNDNSGGNYTYNDQMLLISYNDVMPLVEYRVARDAKKCLDEYATTDTSDHNYPWPAKISNNDYTSLFTTPNILFGRLPIRPNVFTTDPVALQLLDKMTALQLALDAYEANNTANTRSTLDTVGDALENFADCIGDHAVGCTGSPVSDPTANDAEDAGDLAQELAEVPSGSTVSAVQNKIDDAISGLVGDGVISHASVPPNTMPTYWTNCPMLSTWNNATHVYEPADYWDDWKSLLFYQVSNNCRPYWGTCSASGGNLTINSSGPYRAAVVLARKMKVPPEIDQSARTPISATNLFLESNNVQNETDTTPNDFLTYKASDTVNYSTVNDLVLCLDGVVNCL